MISHSHPGIVPNYYILLVVRSVACLLMLTYFPQTTRWDTYSTVLRHRCALILAHLPVPPPPLSEMAADKAFKVLTSSFPRRKLSSTMNNTVSIDMIKLLGVEGDGRGCFRGGPAVHFSVWGVAEVQGC